MSVYHPQGRLTASSCERSTEGRTCYIRDSAERLLEVLHVASKKTVAQLCAGKTALKKLKRGNPEDVPTKEEFNSSLDL